MTTDLEAIVNDPEVDIVVEVLGGLEPARSLILLGN
jgi:homoserine dehydrogenase